VTDEPALAGARGHRRGLALLDGHRLDVLELHGLVADEGGHPDGVDADAASGAWEPSPKRLP
jgi:hypothetical protein